MPELKGKIALVTGASRGIGKSISVALAQSGAHVILTSRNMDRLKQVEGEIRSKKGSASCMAADMSEEKQIETLFDGIRKSFDTLDILVNNAGLGIWAKLVDFRTEDLDRILTVNLRGPYLCCKQAMRIMVPANKGHIINITSVQGIRGYESQSAYAASKHGVMGFSKSLAVEAQEHNIRVSVVLPAAVDTEMIREARPDLDPAVLIRPEDIAKSVLFLLSLSDTAMVDQIYVRRMSGRPF
ncbi:MAG: SDR family oxidoreductase [Spirochaetes bacterium]|nr:SDR family oxidoreductase [Spirochaetota bacterium]